MSAVDGKCWLFDWIDEYEITSADQARRAIASPKAISRMFDIAVDASKPSDDLVSLEGQAALIAGQGFNLAGESTCGNFRCTRQEIDVIMSKAWHYFDKIVVAGASPRHTAIQIGETPKKSRSYLYWTLENDVKTLLYLREIGAESWLEFVPNSSLYHCDPCTRERAAEIGLGSAFDDDLRENVISQLEREARIVIKRQGGLWNADIDHEFLIEPMAYKFKKRPTRRGVAARIYDVNNTAMIKDFVKSDLLKLPLASIAQANWLATSSGSADKSVEDRMGRVALRLDLPVVDGLVGRDLLAFIEDEREHFHNFRSSLRKAIRENLTRLDSKSDEEVAAAVLREYVEPELAQITARLKGAQKSLVKKTAAGIGIGALVTSVGLFAAMPLIIGTGVAAAATPLAQVYKYFDDSSSIEMSDMYFLWKLQRTWNRK